MARAKQLRPIDHVTQSLLSEAVRDAGVTHSEIGEMTGMSQNRVSIILRMATPPATVGEVSAIARVIGRSGAEFIAAAEAEVASGRLPETYSHLSSVTSRLTDPHSELMPSVASTTSGWEDDAVGDDSVPYAAHTVEMSASAEAEMMEEMP